MSLVNRFCGLQVVQFECPRIPKYGHISLGDIHVWSLLGAPLPLHAWKGKCCMWIINKRENYFPKIGVVYFRWSNSYAEGSYILWCHPHLESSVGLPFLCMQEKRNVACGLLKKTQCYSLKVSFLDCNQAPEYFSATLDVTCSSFSIRSVTYSLG